MNRLEPPQGGEALQVITVRYSGRECYFDDAGYDPANRGIIMGCLSKNTFYEAGFLKYIRSLNIRGRFVDVGAHIGNHTIFFAVMCEAEHVYAFEPQASEHARLQRNVHINGLQQRVTAYNFALSDRDGEVVTHFAGRYFRFEGRRLDGVVTEPISVIKVDVEGMEVPVLDGSSELLKRWRPIVFAEAHTGDDYRGVKTCLSRYGYQPTHRVFDATPTYEFWPDERMPGRLHRWFAQSVLRPVRMGFRGLRAVLGRVRRSILP